MALTLSRFVVAAAALLGCHTRTSETTTSQGDLPAAARSSSSGRAPEAKQAFGAPITTEPELTLANVLETPERFRDQTITVEGQVRSACTRRGCWMEVAQSADPRLPGCRVTFKDYGFFVPTDSAGAHAKVQGTLGVNTLPPERVAHLESEGGRFPNKRGDGSVDELRLVATGVELWR
jgi:Domain of unknown function (DUF4920)